MFTVHSGRPGRSGPAASGSTITFRSSAKWEGAGGFGASGFGKDMSDYSFEEYLSIKHVMSDITAVVEKPWHRTIFTLRP